MHRMNNKDYYSILMFIWASDYWFKTDLKICYLPFKPNVHSKIRFMSPHAKADTVRHIVTNVKINNMVLEKERETEWFGLCVRVCV